MILVCGEALVDLVEFGEEFGAPLLRVLPGGSPANAAVALARLGQPTALACRLGRDAWGDLVRRHLEREEVSTAFLIEAAEPTTAAVVAFASSGDARYSFYFDSTASACWRPGDLPAVAPAGLEAFHFGSMAVAPASGRSVIGAFVDQVRAEAVVSIDPNVRRAVIGDLGAYRSSLEGLVSRCHLVRVSADDLDVLYPGRGPDHGARAWSRLGPRLVVVSLGANGALAAFEDATFPVPAVPVGVVDTIGAGDTFSAALLDAFARAGVLHDGLAGLSRPLLESALEFASAAAAITCERLGADPPTRAEVEARLGRSA